MSNNEKPKTPLLEMLLNEQDPGAKAGNTHDDSRANWFDDIDWRETIRLGWVFKPFLARWRPIFLNRLCCSFNICILNHRDCT